MDFIRNILLSNTVKSNTNKHGKQFLNWDKITTIYLLIDETSVDKNKLDNFFSNLNKHIEVGYTNITSKSATFSDWHCFTKNETNFLKLPNKNAFIPKTEFDLLINTCSHENHYAISISAVINAKLKCSSFDYNSIYNLIIDKKEASLQSYLQNVVNYLIMIKPR